MPTRHKNCKETELTGLIWHNMTGATVSIMKNSIIFMFFFIYKYLNVEMEHLKIIST